ncbi:hypothetical protein [Cohnella sp. 56]|uniref:hypothetical protein n=1 Tax=Cohnella sp. 56 TaxID=3113722 RepID=UPI0030E9132E
MKGSIIIVLVGLFIVYRIYLRMRRIFVWQTFKRTKLQVATALLGVLGILFFMEGIFSAASLASNVIGIGLGAALAGYGASRTRFEHRGGQWLYRSSPWIGGAVTVLFLARLAFRVYAWSQFDGAGQANMAGQLKSLSGSWTSGLMLVMFAYYIVHNLLLLRRHKQLGGNVAKRRQASSREV